MNKHVKFINNANYTSITAVTNETVRQGSNEQTLTDFSFTYRITKTKTGSTKP